MLRLFALLILLVRVNSSLALMEDIDCANGANEGVFFPHPESCQRYLTCFLGQLIAGECGYGLFFDLERQICEAESRVRCVMPVMSKT
uniref:Putative chitin binding peritrophin-a domain protein n=1 Tax=Aedes albopictus TaxID=7160 RepID=A0A1W7R8S7_AEDAL